MLGQPPAGGRRVVTDVASGFSRTCNVGPVFSDRPLLLVRCVCLESRGQSPITWRSLKAAVAYRRRVPDAAMSEAIEVRRTRVDARASSCGSRGFPGRSQSRPCGASFATSAVWRAQPSRAHRADREPACDLPKTAANRSSPPMNLAGALATPPCPWTAVRASRFRPTGASRTPPCGNGWDGISPEARPTSR